MQEVLAVGVMKERVLRYIIFSILPAFLKVSKQLLRVTVLYCNVIFLQAVCVEGLLHEAYELLVDF